MIGVPQTAVRWFLTRHALDRITEMGLTRADVIAVLDQPEVTWTGTITGDERTVHVAGNLAVVTRDDVVVTVLWHTEGGEPRRRGLNALPGWNAQR